MPKKLPCESCEKLPWSSTAVHRCVHHGMNLDIGCSSHKQRGFMGLDRRDIPNVDFVWCLESVGDPPWWAQQQFGAKAMSLPFPDSCIDKLLASHVIEHLTPSCSIALFDELWRCLKFDGQALIVVPHGNSFGFVQDPTHVAPWNEASPAYFDPAHASGLWNVYRPKPWKIARLHSSPLHNLEIVLEPRKKADGTAIDITIEGSTKKAKRRSAK